MKWVGGGSLFRPTLLESLWFQLVLGALFSTVLPSLLVLAIWPNETYGSPSVQNTVWASLTAVVLGLLWYRRLVRHPGVQGLENVLTVFIITFGTTAAFLLVARVDYSRVYFAASFGATIVGFAVTATRLSLVEQPHFLVVPFGAADRLMRLDKARWTPMHDAHVPELKTAGIAADLRADLPVEWQRMIADAVLAGIPVFHVKQLDEALSGRVDIEHMSENNFGSLLPSLNYRELKSVIDFVAALFLMPILLVPFLVIMICIKLDSPGPVFYRQPRVGLNGRTFSMIKFRSMRGAVEEQRGDARLAAMTQSDDARITRVGRFLRKHRLDELPQIINVMSGEMSWIGPRPEAVALSQWYLSELPFYQYRHIVKPGLSGWAQVNQGHVTNLAAVHEKLRYDFYYIKHFSIWLDIVIAIRTVRTMVWGSGAK